MVTRQLSLQERYPQFKIGRGTYGGLNIFDWNDGTKVSVGNYCSFSFEVAVLLGGEHNLDWVSTFPFHALTETASGQIIPQAEGHPKSKGDINIGHDVWVGAQSMILSGVTLGHGSVVGARSLVNRDIPPYAIAAGNPVRIIRRRFEDHVIVKLLEIAWWDWAPERVERAAGKLQSRNLQDFIDAVDRGEL
jgi:chloramphenicol O-acetyltransferase type B